VGQQLSFFSAHARSPEPADLAGLLCGPGRAVSFGRGSAARLTAPLAQHWRTGPLIVECARRGVPAELEPAPDGAALLVTAFRADLTPLAAEWLDGAAKTVPRGLVPDGGLLRIWALCAGRAVPGAATGYLLGLDPAAPELHEPLRAALGRAGVPSTVLLGRPGGPGLRITGARRLGRLLELVGDAPGMVPDRDWPRLPPRRVSARTGG
jgi:hypothetical protein